MKIITLLLCLSITAHAQMHVTPINDTLSPAQLIQDYFMGNHVTIKNIRYNGAPESLGLFEDPKQAMGFNSGLIISNGNIELLPGKNSRPNAGANLDRHFFFDPDFITKGTMCDGAVLEFDFIPEFDSIAFRFVFGSEEYPEFVGKNFNDVFALLVTPKFGKASKPKNIGTLPNGISVMINNVNHKRNAEWYIANDRYNDPFYDYLEYDGFTRPIVAGLKVIPHKIYHLKILIADLEDCEYDSGVLLDAYSFSSYSTRKPKPVSRQYYFNFGTDSFALKSSDRKRVKQLADSIARFQFDSIIVVGHTDSSGDETHNQLLSHQRAETIAAIFKQNTTLQKTTIVCRGAGSSTPLKRNNTEKGKAANRRVELLFYRKK